MQGRSLLQFGYKLREPFKDFYRELKAKTVCVCVSTVYLPFYHGLIFYYNRLAVQCWEFIMT